MNTRPIVAARLSLDPDGTPYAENYRGTGHLPNGAFTLARQVFLAGNRLPQRWQGREQFVVLETGFGLGHNFLATWQAWRDDPARCKRLTIISIEQTPFGAADMRRAHAHSPAKPLADELTGAWPPLTPNLHCIDFDDGRVRLLLALGDITAWLPELVASVDAFYLDGFAPERNPAMWQARIFKALGRLAAPEATLAAATSGTTLHSGLRAAGFEAHEAPGCDGLPDFTIARFAPAFAPRGAPSRRIAPAANHRALIVGAGLAGCATALALARQGWRSTVIDCQASPACETSGNPGGLFHGIVNAQDGTHARFNRAAALQARIAVGDAVLKHGIAGSVQGLLRLDSADPSTLSTIVERLGLPWDYVHAVTAGEASRLGGVPLTQAAWFYPGGGWVQPSALARHWLQEASPMAQFVGGRRIDSIQRNGRSWRLLDSHGHVIDEAEVLVLANAGDAMRLLGDPGWPIEAVRGQVSQVSPGHAGDLPLPLIPIAGAGYLLPALPDGTALFGATSQAGDFDPAVREADHVANLSQLAKLMGRPVSLRPADLHGRTGWRWSAQDRLPVIGAVPDTRAAGRANRPLDQPRFVPRLEGLFVFTALGSRGITWSTLGASTLASMITGSALPLEASLLDAIDPARFVSRAVRRPASRE